uniref:PB1 domain-containing protein n=1 Tax=Amphimedon queenslandica TaxID=400682 RepID=A0A1X7TZM4_AMPQE
MLRYSSPDEFSTVDTLREGIRSQFGSNLIPSIDFEIGYLKGQQKLWIRCDDDLKDAWDYIKKGTGSFWCTGPGVNKSKKRKLATENDSASDSEEEVQNKRN